LIQATSRDYTMARAPTTYRQKSYSEPKMVNVKVSAYQNRTGVEMRESSCHKD